MNIRVSLSGYEIVEIVQRRLQELFPGFRIEAGYVSGETFVLTNEPEPAPKLEPELHE